MPQLALQQISPTLHVLGPQLWLSGHGDMPHTACEQRSPGAAHVPQLALQHTLPDGQVAAPQGTGGGGAALDEAAGVAAEGTGAGGDAEALALAEALGTFPLSSSSMGGST